ncbi:hypothetical protein [Pseudomonas phage vB_PaeM_PS119XW]|uniref:Uncharacterized protein n=1 Tax=Pseudomonas phage vB_PaeM_PS119XW TaxID=2601632 RepID=A0A5C1K832_9CAUD|nr:hypothetical protein PP933_gp210 [Pseudomonas phage vB_PaeM_PS119XW]QEM41939.1 hypothetical protein [Pseudomonas phage vB_PaeM_PS119XW]
MFNPETLDAVRDAAQAFTEQERVLTIPNPEFPLAVYADGFNCETEGNKVAMSDELAASVEAHFVESNVEAPENVNEEREAIISNMHTAIAKIQFNTQNVIIPAIKAMATDYASRQNVSSQADCDVSTFNYDPIHNDPRLVNHIQTRYAKVRPLPEYRTFMLRPVDAATIIEMVSINNPHLDQEQVTEWALKIPAQRVENVWSELFGTARGLTVSNLSFINPNAFPFNLDELTLAYFICGHYIENPQEVPGESVTSEEWEQTVRLLHEMLGFYIIRAYENRLEMRESNTLVLRYEAHRPVENRRVLVTLNGDVAESWLVKGGSVEALLGAAIDGGNVVHAQGIDARADHYIKRWTATYPLIKQAALDYAESRRRQDVIDTFLAHCGEGPLREMNIGNVRELLATAMRFVRREDLDNPYCVFSNLICRTYYTEPMYKLYLDTIDEYGQNFPGAELRELNTQALISLIAIFQAQQIKVETFNPDVDPNATLPEPEEVPEEITEPTSEEVADAVGDAVEGEGPLAETPEVEDEEDPYADETPTESETEEVEEEQEEASEEETESETEEEEQA